MLLEDASQMKREDTNMKYIMKIAKVIKKKIEGNGSNHVSNLVYRESISQLTPYFDCVQNISYTFSLYN